MSQERILTGKTGQNGQPQMMRRFAAVSFSVMKHCIRGRDTHPVRTVVLCIVLLGAMAFCSQAWAGQEQGSKMTFEIKEYVIKGNTLLTYERLTDALRSFTGPGCTAADVERARRRLETLYHDEGYPTVLVNIPQQEVNEGIVILEVIESTIGEVRVTGNRFYTREKILEKLTSFKSGEILYIPRVQYELNRMNRNVDLEVTPLLMPGRKIGTTDVELRVKDHFPLHGSIEYNNRHTHDTTDTRINGIVRYDNLWQREHSLTLQYQTSPQDSNEVQVCAASYVMPAWWNVEHIVALYAVDSDSETAFGEGFEVIGKGRIYGMQYVIPLPYYNMYFHSVSFGIDYKDFEESMGYQGGENALETPLTYMPVSVGYRSSLLDTWGRTSWSSSLNFALRGIVTDREEFEAKRYKAKGNYTYLKLGIERDQVLPFGFRLSVKCDGQISDQPLVSNEQYAAGGMTSVRGYMESEGVGDDAVHATVEFMAPDIAEVLGMGDLHSVVPYLFYDTAGLRTLEPLPEQDDDTGLRGAGFGVRGRITRYLEFQADWAWALKDTDKTDKHDSQAYFRIKGQF